MLEIFGWVGGFLLTTCAVPLAWQSYKNGHSTSLSHIFLWMWLGGEVLVLIYIFPQFLWPLIINYGFNIILICIILWYKFKPRNVLTQNEK